MDVLEVGDSDRVLSGTGLLDVTIEDERVTLHGRPQLVGTTTEMIDLVVSLIDTVFVQLEREGLDTHSIAEAATENLNFQTIDPVSIHDTLMD